MVAVANLQYGWTFFVPSIVRQLNSTTALVPVTFTKQSMSGMVRSVLFGIGGVLVLYRLTLTVWPKQLPPAGLAKWTVPAIGYQGVFAIAAVFDVVASAMAFLVLRQMRVPVGGTRPSVATAPAD